MEIYDFEDFQKKVAKFSVSPYAEAITSLAGLSPQVVSIATRLASSYASLRGTVQLLTTDEDNKIIDETTPARETIARSAVVGAWNSIGSAVERLISLRKSLSDGGVAKVVKNYPYDYSAKGNSNYCGILTPTLIASGDITSEGYTVFLPDNITDYGMSLEGTIVVPLRPQISEPMYRGVFTTNAKKGDQYAVNDIKTEKKPQAKLGSLGVITCAFAVLDGSSPSTLRDVIFQVISIDDSNYVLHTNYYKQNVDVTMSHSNPGYYSRRFTNAPTIPLTGSVLYDTLKYVVRSRVDQPANMTRQIIFPQSADDEITFDPFDPREVFTQAYEAASAILELMEAMGYTSGLSESDKELLTQ